MVRGDSIRTPGWPKSAVGENELTAIALCRALTAQSLPGAAGDPDGGAYQKDLGPNTAKAAATLVRYRIDRTWTSAGATP
jgi:hypothetical protein